MQYFSPWAAMFENVGPNEALTSHLTKLSEINKYRQSRKSWTPVAKLSHLIFEPQCSSSSEEEEGEEQELIIKSDNIKGNSVCCIQLLQCWKSKEVV